MAAPVLAAAQGVCGNDTARAAEIPPPDIGWKVEQLVRDNQWRSIAARRGRTARGRGGAAGRSGGTRGRGQKTHRFTKGHSRVSRTHNLHRETSLWATNTTKESHSPQLHKSLIQVTTQQDQTPGLKRHTTGSEVRNNDTEYDIQSVTLSHNQDTIHQGLTLSQYAHQITRTENKPNIPLAGLNHTTLPVRQSRKVT